MVPSVSGVSVSGITIFVRKIVAGKVMRIATIRSRGAQPTPMYAPRMPPDTSAIPLTITTASSERVSRAR